jgi:hypothetical protein
MVLENYVILKNDTPSRLHFYDHSFQRRTITDSSTGLPSLRNVLVFEVDRLDFRPVVAKLSIMAEKFAGQFEPYLEGKAYRDYEFIVTQRGDGYLRSWTVQVVPLEK